MLFLKNVPFFLRLYLGNHLKFGFPVSLLNTFFLLVYSFNYTVNRKTKFHLVSKKNDMFFEKIKFQAKLGHQIRTAAKLSNTKNGFVSLDNYLKKFDMRRRLHFMCCIVFLNNTNHVLKMCPLFWISNFKFYNLNKYCNIPRILTHGILKIS